MILSDGLKAKIAEWQGASTEAFFMTRTMNALREEIEEGLYTAYMSAGDSWEWLPEFALLRMRIMTQTRTIYQEALERRAARYKGDPSGEFTAPREELNRTLERWAEDIKDLRQKLFTRYVER